MRLGDFVKVKDQDITGVIVEVYGNKAVIEDDSSEYEAPENRLEYFLSDLENAE
jgi:hypothetical protein